MQLLIKIGDEWKSLTISQTENIRLNSSWDNLENPMLYISDNSYSMKVPRDSNNELIFNNFYKLDSAFVVNNTYDPRYKIECMILNDLNQIVDKGEVYVSQVTRTEYTIQFFGSLSYIFSKMKNSGFDKSKANDSKYNDYTLLADPLQDLSLYMCGSLVRHSWSIHNPLPWNVAQKTNKFKTAYGIVESSTNYNDKWLKAMSLIGFCPSMGRNADFESKEWLVRQCCSGKSAMGFNFDLYNTLVPCTLVSNGLTFTTVMQEGHINHNTDEDEGKLYSKINRVYTTEPVLEVGDGFQPAQMWEYRSYYQQPFIYVQSLFKLIQEQAEEKFNYKINLDKDLFDTNSESNDIYILPQLKITEPTYSERKDLGNYNDTPYIYNKADSNEYWENSTQNALNGNATDTIEPMAIIHTANSAYCELHDGKIGEFDISGEIILKNDYYDDRWILMNTNWNPILVEIDVMNGSTQVNHYTKKLAIFPNLKYNLNNKSVDITTVETATNQNPFVDLDNGYTQKVINDLKLMGYNTLTVDVDCGNTNTTDSNGKKVVKVPWSTTYSINPYFTKDNYNVENPTVRVRTKTSFYSNMNPFKHYNKVMKVFANCAKIEMQNNITSFGVREYECPRSGRKLDMNTILGEVNWFDILLKYSKMKHFLWIIDNETDTIRVCKCSTYLSECKENIQNISKSIDYKDMIIKPLSFDYHRIIFNFDGDFNGYADIYEYPQGSMKVVTDNHISQPDNELYGLSNSPINYSQKIYPLRFLNYLEPVENYMLPLNVEDGKNMNRSDVFYKRLKVGRSWNEALVRDFEYGKYYGYGVLDLINRTFTGVIEPSPIISDDYEEELNANKYAYHSECLSSPDDYYRVDTPYGMIGFDRLVKNSSMNTLQYYKNTKPYDIFKSTAYPINYAKENGAMPIIQSYDSNENLVFGRSYEVYSKYDESMNSRMINGVLTYTIPTLYENYWKNYCTEIYSVKNKYVTCTAYLNYQEYKSLKYNPFCIIEDMLYFCTSIEEYNTIDRKCKLILRQVSDLDGISSKRNPYRLTDLDNINI